MNQIAKATAAIGSVRVRPMSTQVAEVRQNINLLHEAMKATMKEGVHFGTIPGCPKKSLFKPGAEVIMTLFKLSSDPIPTDLSKDGEIRYQVRVNVAARDGSFIGAGIGECSSQEEKYMWRGALCQEEFEATPEVLRRIKFKKGYNNGPVQQIQQIRVSPSDMANTILKMAKKRALIDAVLTATAASDIFSQDIEDLPEGFIPPEAVTMPPEPPAAPPAPPTAEELAYGEDSIDMANLPISLKVPSEFKKPTNPISEPQRKRLFAIAMGAGMSKDRFKDWLKQFNYESSKDIDRSDYDNICTAAECYNPIAEEIS